MIDLGAPTSRDFVEKVRDAVDIVRVVSEYVTLKPAGTRMKGLCPFHEEKTPSFTVDPERKLFYCFGCQTGGDLFKFVMLYESVEFPEAVRILAERFGVPVPRPADRSPAADRRQRVLEINALAETYFREQLRSDAGRSCRDYVQRRGLSAELAESLGLGFAADSWDGLRRHLVAQGVRPAEIVEAGLALPRKSSPGEYDRFRNRLIFPIRDVTGRTVAFGGRALADDQEPKYVNSPETPAYVKGEHLYGLHAARDAIRRAGQAVVVEGYLDLAAVLGAGIENAVASLGTAFTPAQARLIARYAQRVTFSYDGDAAGSTAAVRSLDLLLERGFDVRVVDLPAGLDPDDTIRQRGADVYRRLVGEAPGYLEFLVLRETRGRELTRIDEKVQALNAVLPHVARLTGAVQRAEWAGRLADALGVDEAMVLQDLKDAVRAGKTAVRPPRADAGNEEASLRPVESRLVALILRYEEVRREARERLEPEDLEGSNVTEIVQALLQAEGEGGPMDPSKVLDTLPREEDRALLTRIAFQDELESHPQDFEDCLRTLRRERLMREHRELRHAIERAVDGAALDSLLARTQQLARQIDALS